MEYLTKSIEKTDPTYDPNAIIRVVTITRYGDGGGYTCSLDDAAEILLTEITTDPEPGDRITITHGLKTQLELDNMPEFDGW